MYGVRALATMTTLKDILKAKGFTIDFGYIKDAFAQTEGWHIKLHLKRQSPPARSFIHECIHYLNPEMPEKEVLKLESKLWKSATQKEIEKIYRKIFK